MYMYKITFRNPYVQQHIYTFSCFLIHSPELSFYPVSDSFYIKFLILDCRFNGENNFSACVLLKMSLSFFFL